jgi:glycosyltransferase involved in cell wall biosynthesis
MACGLPAVVSNVGDLADLVQDGSNGYLITDLIPSNFAGRIIELLRSPALLREFSDAARRSALSLDAAVMAQRWDLILSFADNPYEPADGTTDAHYTISGLGAKTP